MSSINTSYAFLLHPSKLQSRLVTNTRSFKFGSIQRSVRRSYYHLPGASSGMKFSSPHFHVVHNKEPLLQGMCRTRKIVTQKLCGRLHATVDGTSSKEAETISFENLHEVLRKAYFEEGETDGVLKLAPSIIGMDKDFTGADIIQAALEASNNNKGQASGIINALIASCYSRSRRQDKSSDGDEDGSVELFAAMAWDIYTSWEELADELGSFKPDIVTLCCTYSALDAASESSRINREDADYFRDCAGKVLDTAQRRTKKITGSKRRKLLVSISRRHGKNAKNGSDYLDALKASYGEDFDVLYEDDNVIVVNKPAGMVCFHSRKTTDGRIGRKKKQKGGKKKKKGKQNSNVEEGKNDAIQNDISLEDALVDVGVPLSTLNKDALGIVHRIDRGTSGCIILAKNDHTHAQLVTSFFLREVKKTYNALVPYYSSDDLEHELEEAGDITEEVGGRPALSSFRVDRSFGTSALLLNVDTSTGRKHQVRIHCAKGLGRPIFLDPLYSSDNQNGKKENVITQDENLTKSIDKVADSDGRRFFLHASSIQADDFNVDVTASLPSWWSKVLDAIEK